MVFELADMASEQAFCEPVFGLETASQAEYAGSIPVIGSTTTWGDTPNASASRDDGPVTVPYSAALIP